MSPKAIGRKTTRNKDCSCTLWWQISPARAREIYNGKPHKHKKCHLDLHSWPSVLGKNLLTRNSMEAVSGNIPCQPSAAAGVVLPC